MTGTRRDQPLPRQDCVGYLLNLKPGADLTAEDLRPHDPLRPRRADLRMQLVSAVRRHHQTKQARSWQLTQPEPGLLIWTTPSGRTYTTKAEPYPV
jgi:hypothetical protein